MKTPVLLAINLLLVFVFVVIIRKRNLLTYHHSGRLMLTWLAIGIITLMDEFTSIFYAPAESFRFIGLSAIIFIALTSILIRFMCTRFNEIAEILEHHGLIGGGVYSFSYHVLGPTMSFIAVSSIMVDYILTACISAVSAVLNAASFFPPILESQPMIIALVLAIIWFIAGLNILGIRENARFTFVIFAFAAFVILNLAASGVLALDAGSFARIKESGLNALSQVQTGSFIGNYENFITHIAFCILAYSGIESVIQTAGFVRNWHDIRKAYLFLALTVGIITPLIAGLALSSATTFSEHEGDLITYYATTLNGVAFGVTVAVLASLTLMMAVNTAFVASSELIERVAHRYGFEWIIATNRRHSLYRIHIVSALFFSAIVLITSGSQTVLADMYAIGLVASFCINMGSLLIYRYSMGTKEVISYHTSRLGTLLLWIILVSCFIFLAIDKPHGTMLWGFVTVVVPDGRSLGGQKARSGNQRNRAGRQRNGIGPLPRRLHASGPPHHLPEAARGSHHFAQGKRSLRHLFLAAAEHPIQDGPEPFPVSSEKIRALPEDDRPPARGGSGIARPQRLRLLRLAHVLMAGPPGDRRDGL